MLQFTSFSKKYGHVKILNIGDYTLPKGLVWLKGVNGAGKSTLLSCAAGILPFSGDISLLEDKQSLRKNSLGYRRTVNFSEADPIFPTFLTGKEIIDFFRAAKAGTDKQTSNLIDIFRAQTFIHQSTSTYSSGMNKKLSLILAFIGSPSVILLDEPFITLDQSAQQVLSALIAEKRREDCNILVSSHQMLTQSAILPFTEILLKDKTLTSSASSHGSTI